MSTPNYNFILPTVGGDSNLWGGYLNSNWSALDSILNLRTQDYNFADFLLIRPEIKDYAETKQDVTAAGTTDFDLSAGNIINLSQGTNISSLTFSNPSATGRACSFTLIRTKDNTGTARTIAWPASVKWAGATAPTLTQTANAVDILVFTTINGGTTWYGFTAGLNMS
jgi:hypothetical protein